MRVVFHSIFFWCIRVIYVVILNTTRWVALMIQLGRKFVGGWGGVADTNYLYPARWGWIKN